MRRTSSMQELREAIADAIWTLNAGDVPDVCRRLGLREGTVDEAFSSKRKYVKVRLADHSEEQLLALANAVTRECHAPKLEDFLSELTTHAVHRVTDLTRRSAVGCLDSIGVLFGDLDLFEELEVLSPTWDSASPWSTYGYSTLRQAVQQHFVRNEDKTSSELLIACGALKCSQQRFFDLLARLTHPECRRGKEQLALVAAFNEVLVADGFALTMTGELSRHPVYEVRAVSEGSAASPKNLIFSSINTKPDLVLVDAISNDVSIVNDSDALIYDLVIPSSGLAWNDLARWWMDRQELPDIDSGRRALFKRLREAVRATGSPGEYAVFDAYYAHFSQALGDRLPALVPQVYLHYDPRTSAERGADRALVRQRMDFLLLLEHGARIVVEVDGQQHFAENGRASPAKYADMAAEDRRIRLLGYEVYRFGAAEFEDVQMVSGRLSVGGRSRKLVVTFFERLFEKHPPRRNDEAVPN